MANKRPPLEILTHWNQLVKGLQYDPEKFYDRLKEKINEKEVPKLDIFELKLKTGGAFSAERIYLRVTSGKLVFDICGAPYGTKAFFFSYWLGTTESRGWFLTILLFVLSIIPIVGLLFKKISGRMTYYEHDTASMFQALIDDIVMETIDEITGETKIKSLSPEEKVPQIKKLGNI